MTGTPRTNMIHTRQHLDNVLTLDYPREHRELRFNTRPGLCSMQAAIIAGGLATRLGALTKGQAKSMIQVGGKPFLQHQIELLRSAGVRDIVLCTGHLGDQIERYFKDGASHGVSITYSREKRSLGTAGALKKAGHLLDDVFFTLYGDSYVFLDFAAVMSCFKTMNKMALMTVFKNNDLYDRSNVVVKDGFVSKYSKTDKTPGMVYIDYGVNLFDKRVLEMIPVDEAYGMEGLFEQLIAKRELLSYEVGKRFYEIGSHQGLAEFQALIDAGVTV
ncbi:MAG: NTP transferase domain-containing protein [Chloroflexi bacterium]|nr:NTP transferase domain-containing protein [Chloroflexota bacterium]